MKLESIKIGFSTETSSLIIITKALSFGTYILALVRNCVPNERA